MFATQIKIWKKNEAKMQKCLQAAPANSGWKKKNQIAPPNSIQISAILRK